MTGHGDSNGKNVPTLVKDVSNVGQVACGSSHTIVVSQDGRIVWSFGGGDNGNITHLLCSFYVFLIYTTLVVSVYIYIAFKNRGQIVHIAYYREAWTWRYKQSLQTQDY